MPLRRRGSSLERRGIQVLLDSTNWQYQLKPTSALREEHLLQRWLRSPALLEERLLQRWLQCPGAPRGAPTAEMAAVPMLLGGLGCMNPIDRTEEVPLERRSRRGCAVGCVVASSLPAISSLSTNPCHQRQWQRKMESIPVESWRMPGVVSRLSRLVGRWQREGGAFERPSFCFSGP